jgi:WD40 repeat protein
MNIIKKFDEKINCISILDDIIVVGGEFNYIYVNYQKIAIKNKILALSNDKKNRFYAGYKDGNISYFDVFLKGKKIEIKKLKIFNSYQKIIDSLIYLENLNLLVSASSKNKDINIWSREGIYLKTIEDNYPIILSCSLKFPYLYCLTKYNHISIKNVFNFKNIKTIADEKEIIDIKSKDSNLIIVLKNGILKFLDEENFICKKIVDINFEICSFTLFKNSLIFGTNGIIKFYDLEGRHEKDKVVDDNKITFLENYKSKLYFISNDSLKLIQL